MHHVHEPELSDIYNFFPEVEFVTISDFQRNRENHAAHADHSSWHRSEPVSVA